MQEGLLSDPPGMNMYKLVGFHPKTRLARLRTLRNSSDLEGHFLHYSRALHPTAKAASGTYLDVRSNLFDLSWTLKAAAAAGRMKDIGHSQPWLIDALADVCRGWLPETDLPPLLCDWKRTDTSRERRRAVHVPWHRLRDAESACKCRWQGHRGLRAALGRRLQRRDALSGACAQARLASPCTGNWRLHQREAPARSRQALLREEPHRRRVEGARTAATAGTATSHGRWYRSTCAASAGNGAVDGSGGGGAAAVYQWGGRRKAGRDSSRSRRSGIA